MTVHPYRVSEKNFFYIERLAAEDNQILYEAGPYKIYISGWEEIIEISSEKRWSDMVEDIRETIKDAWEIKEEEILYNTEIFKVIKEKNKIEEYKKRLKGENILLIKLNYNILKMYIEHKIIFM